MSNQKAVTDYPPKLSIVIATWQAAKTLKRCLRSTIDQSFTNWELLVADGGSTDGTVDIIRQHANHLAWWTSEADTGIYDAWNKAVRIATGEYVCFIGADDAWADDDALCRIFSEVNRSTFDLVTSCGLFQNSQSERGKKFGSAWNYRKIGRHMIVCHPGMLHHRSLFEKFGLFDTTYKIAGDLEFLLRLPESTKALHVETISVVVESSGISRSNVLERLKEQRTVLENCDRYGTLRAYVAWLDKLWRLPIARAFNISH